MLEVSRVHKLDAFDLKIISWKKSCLTAAVIMQLVNLINYKLIGSLHYMPGGHSTQALNNFPWGWTRSHYLMRSDPTSWTCSFCLISPLFEKLEIPFFSGSLECEMPNIIRYELKFADDQKCPKKAAKNKNEPTFIIAFDEILEWLIRGSKN